MASAQCSNCGTMMWDVEEGTNSYHSVPPEGAVGSRFWCNSWCFLRWHRDNPERITIQSYEGDKPIIAWRDDDGMFHTERHEEEDLPLEHNE